MIVFISGNCIDGWLIELAHLLIDLLTSLQISLLKKFQPPCFRDHGYYYVAHTFHFSCLASNMIKQLPSVTLISMVISAWFYILVGPWQVINYQNGYLIFLVHYDNECIVYTMLYVLSVGELRTQFFVVNNVCVQRIIVLDRKHNTIIIIILLKI